ncbi:hypothetical protein [Rathayibacter rathayi]|uniref:hypothetical protein n=1 Tax=Rathayibacter rathayi TaxID=33887 RepID=UPI0015E30E90|nr:hypothetical protein [Rathayibacter rathayi]
MKAKGDSVQIIFDYAVVWELEDGDGFHESARRDVGQWKGAAYSIGKKPFRAQIVEARARAQADADKHNAAEHPEATREGVS